MMNRIREKIEGSEVSSGQGEASVATFDHETFGKIRIIDEQGKPWFVGKEIATALGYSDTTQAIRKNCKKQRKMALEVAINKGMSAGRPHISQYQEYVIIPESDVYRLIFRSKLPSAEAFQDWVFEEVLPQIRKTGQYGHDSLEQVQGKLDKTNQVIEAMQYLITAKDELEKQVSSLKPDAEYARAVVACKGLLTVSEVAKAIGMRSAQQLNTWMKEKGIIFKRAGKWHPTAKYSEQGYFQYYSHVYQGDDGEQAVSNYLKITQKGKRFIFGEYYTSDNLLLTA